MKNEYNQVTFYLAQTASEPGKDAAFIGETQLRTLESSYGNLLVTHGKSRIPDNQFALVLQYNHPQATETRFRRQCVIKAICEHYADLLDGKPFTTPVEETTIPPLTLYQWDKGTLENARNIQVDLIRYRYLATLLGAAMSIVSDCITDHPDSLILLSNLDIDDQDISFTFTEIRRKQPEQAE